MFRSTGSGKTKFITRFIRELPDHSPDPKSRCLVVFIYNLHYPDFSGVDSARCEITFHSGLPSVDDLLSQCRNIGHYERIFVFIDDALTLFEALTPDENKEWKKVVVEAQRRQFSLFLVTQVCSSTVRSLVAVTLESSYLVKLLFSRIFSPKKLPSSHLSETIVPTRSTLRSPTICNKCSIWWDVN